MEATPKKPNKCLYYYCDNVFENEKKGYCSEKCAGADEAKTLLEKTYREQMESEKIKKDYEFIEIEAQKINLQPGETLMVTIKNSYIEPKEIQHMGSEFRKVFPNNKVFLFSVELEGDIKFATVSQPEIKVAPVTNPGYCTVTNPGYCTDCSCGKKEAVEGKNEKV